MRLDYPKKFSINTLFLALLALTFDTVAMGRNIYLNGRDISSAKSQKMENVTLQIDQNGNIYIEAPHYEVQEENTFIPLSSWKANQMEHKIGKDLSEPTKMKPAGTHEPQTKQSELTEKSGQKVQ